MLNYLKVLVVGSIYDTFCALPRSDELRALCGAARGRARQCTNVHTPV